MSQEHKRPLYAFLVLLVACSLVMVHGLRSEAVQGLLRVAPAAIVAGVELHAAPEARPTRGSLSEPGRRDPQAEVRADRATDTTAPQASGPRRPASRSALAGTTSSAATTNAASATTAATTPTATIATAGQQRGSRGRSEPRAPLAAPPAPGPRSTAPAPAHGPRSSATRGSRHGAASPRPTRSGRHVVATVRDRFAAHLPDIGRGPARGVSAPQLPAPPRMGHRGAHDGARHGVPRLPHLRRGR